MTAEPKAVNPKQSVGQHRKRPGEAVRTRVQGRSRRLLQEGCALIRFKIVLAAILSTTVPLSADTMSLYCKPIKNNLVEAKLNTKNEHLTEREREDLAYFQEHARAVGIDIKENIYVFRFGRPSAPKMSLMSTFIPIFPCSGRCIGTTVLRGKSGTRIQNFTYAQFVIINPYPSHEMQRSAGRYFQRGGASYIFSDLKQMNFVSFRHIWRGPKISDESGVGLGLRPIAAVDAVVEIDSIWNPDSLVRYNNHMKRCLLDNSYD